jgi:hypothetical protein
MNAARDLIVLDNLAAACAKMRQVMHDVCLLVCLYMHYIYTHTWNVGQLNCFMFSDDSTHI